jgi:formate dehydrogenase subunit gamma
LMVSDALTDILDLHKGRDGALLPILHDVQATFGHISEADIRTIASALNLTRAEVHGVVSFYHDFKTAPDARPVIKLCRAEACKARGVEALVVEAEAIAGSRVKIETIYCLGLCSIGPAAMIGGEVYARLTPEKLAVLVAQS